MSTGTLFRQCNKGCTPLYVTLALQYKMYRKNNTEPRHASTNRSESSAVSLVAMGETITLVLLAEPSSGKGISTTVHALGSVTLICVK